ncbi:MAG: isoprenylcysteine carboxylmethyltransferase family protein [Anaerolineae bacterium]|nr:isoprenylcysteine carboxylmethyltransferase family protein [Anaerolineae bacterium]
MSSTTSSPTQASRLDKYGFNCIARHVFMGIVVAALLFGGAGTTDWAWGWVFSIVHLLGWIGLSYALARWNPELLNQRGRRSRDLTGTKRWDWLLLGIYSTLVLVQPFVGGLDYRYGWTGRAAPVVYIVGDVLVAGAFALLTWSMVVNRHFEATVRIQEARDHQVVAAGPYRYVRHPGYVAVIVTFLGVGLAVGSLAALVLGAIGTLLFIVRTALEDQTLQAELPGYAEFAQRTRYRLLPGVW